MSNNIVTINNSTYEFNVYMGNRKACKSCVLPITKGSIEYLEIEDNLSFPGVQGVISISNFDGILQKLNIFDINTGINVIGFDITNKDFLAFNSRPQKLSFQAILSQAGESSANMVDKKIALTFEEDIVSLLRNKVFPLTDTNNRIDTREGTASSYLKKIITSSLNESEENIIGQFEPTILPAPPGAVHTLLMNNYELLRRIYRHTFYYPGEPGLLTVKSVCEDNDFKRKYVLINLGKYIREFFEKLKSSESDSNVDLSDYVTDTFTMGGTFTNKTLGANFVDKYDIIKPDYKDVLSKKWVDYRNSFTDNIVSGATLNEYIPYRLLRNYFQKAILGFTYESNLPEKSLAKTTQQGESEILTTDNTFAVTPEIREWADSLISMIMKSFIFDNIAITFRVQGNVYREPGKFIRVIASNESSKDVDDINGYYFVTSVKHIFKGSGYENEIIAVKFYLNRNTTLTESGFYEQLFNNQPIEGIQDQQN